MTAKVTLYSHPTLAPYSGEGLTRCPKCGWDAIATHYHAGYDCGRERCTTCEREHLLRVCTRCRHQWPEAPVDAVSGSGVSTEEHP